MSKEKGDNVARRYLDYIEPMDGYELWQWASECAGVEFSCIISDCVDNGDPEEEIEELKARHASCLATAQSSRASNLRRVLDKSLRDAYDPVEEQSVDEPAFSKCPPMWPTGLAEIDEKTGGGGYGLTVYAGEPKVGKSFLALSSAVEAARKGWRVLYLNCELSRDEMAGRLHRYVEEGFTPELVRRLTIFNMNVGFNIESVTNRFIEKVNWRDTKMLIVLDSINRAADLSSEHDGSESNYWGLLRKWMMLAMQSRRQSHGEISWLIVSELNRAKEVKGQSLEYIADMVVRLENSDIEDMAKIDIAMSRSTASGLVGDGFFLRDHQRSRFVGRQNVEGQEGNLVD